MRSLVIALGVLLSAASFADWRHAAEVGFMDFKGVPVYQAGVFTEKDRLQWRLAYSRADHENADITTDWDSRHWLQLSFQYAWQLPVARVHWFVGGSYTVDENGKVAPGLGSKANFHLGLFRNFGERWRVSFRHDSNGDLATKECTDVNRYLRFDDQLGSWRRVDEICTGQNNRSQNYLTLARFF